MCYLVPWSDILTDSNWSLHRPADHITRVHQVEVPLAQLSLRSRSLQEYPHQGFMLPTLFLACPIYPISCSPHLRSKYITLQGDFENVSKWRPPPGRYGPLEPQHGQTQDPDLPSPTAVICQFQPLPSVQQTNPSHRNLAMVVIQWFNRRVVCCTSSAWSFCTHSYSPKHLATLGANSLHRLAMEQNRQ